MLTMLLVSAGGCGNREADYFPLEGGRSWEYQVTVKILDETTRSKRIVRSIGIVDFEGLQVSVFEHPGGIRDYYAHTESGIKRIGTARGVDGRVKRDPDNHFVLPEPLKPGSSWFLTSQLGLIESVYFDAGESIRARHSSVVLHYRIAGTDEDVTVAAGHFSGCVRVEATGELNLRVNRGLNFGHVYVTHTDWYAPGVGLVKSHRIETSDSPYLKPGEYLLELERVQ